MLFGLAVFLFFFGLFPYWFKLHKHLKEILGCAYPLAPRVSGCAFYRIGSLLTLSL